MTKNNPFGYFKTGLEIIRLAVMLYIRFPLSQRNLEDLLHERPFLTFAKQNTAGTGYRCKSRNSPVLVEQIWTVIRR